MRRAERILAALGLALSLAALQVGPAWLDLISRVEASGLAAAPRCAYRARTGNACLGCGGTRALRLAAGGDLKRAADANPLGAFAGFGLWLLAAGSAGGLLLDRSRIALGTLAGVLALFPAAFVWNAVRWWLSLPPGASLW